MTAFIQINGLNKQQRDAGATIAERHAAQAIGNVVNGVSSLAVAAGVGREDGKFVMAKLADRVVDSAAESATEATAGFGKGTNLAITILAGTVAGTAAGMAAGWVGRKITAQVLKADRYNLDPHFKSGALSFCGEKEAFVAESDSALQGEAKASFEAWIKEQKSATAAKAEATVTSVAAAVDNLKASQEALAEVEATGAEGTERRSEAMAELHEGVEADKSSVVVGAVKNVGDQASADILEAQRLNDEANARAIIQDMTDGKSGFAALTPGGGIGKDLPAAGGAQKSA